MGGHPYPRSVNDNMFMRSVYDSKPDLILDIGSKWHKL